MTSHEHWDLPTLTTLKRLFSRMSLSREQLVASSRATIEAQVDIIVGRCTAALPEHVERTLGVRIDPQDTMIESFERDDTSETIYQAIWRPNVFALELYGGMYDGRRLEHPEAGARLVLNDLDLDLVPPQGHLPSTYYLTAWCATERHWVYEADEMRKP